VKKIFILFLSAIALLFSIKLFAQDGSLDASFDVGSGTNSYIWTSVIQSNGKIIIGGNFTSYNGTAINHVARLNTDGSLDAGFYVGPGANNEVFATAIQSDGKIIIGGSFTSYYGMTTNRIARLNTDGSPDASFNIGTGTNNDIATILIQDDGKIIIGGDFTSYNGTARGCIARLNTDGSLDASFNAGLGAAGTNSSINTTAIQSDGKIIVGGNFTSYNGTAINRIARLNTDGSLDTSFVVGTGVDNYVFRASIQNDGKILIGGWFTTFNGSSRNWIARLNSDGSLDATFNAWAGINNTVQTFLIQSDGKIIVGGSFNYGIIRLNTNGTLDTGFNNGGDGAYTILTANFQSDGKIVIAGYFALYNSTVINNIVRINNNISVTGITNYAQANGLSVFPNPNNGDFTISLSKEETFSLVNNLGQIVQTVELNQGNNNSATVSGVQNGIYFLVGKSNALLNYKIVVANW
jgi:uncharacterized delta-60 repeat protein